MTFEDLGVFFRAKKRVLVEDYEVIRLLMAVACCFFEHHLKFVYVTILVLASDKIACIMPFDLNTACRIRCIAAVSVGSRYRSVTSSTSTRNYV